MRIIGATHPLLHTGGLVPHPQFPQDRDVIHLNHAGVGAWPRRTAEVVRAFADENVRRGSANYMAWLETEKRLHARLAALIGAPDSDDIALVKSTSEGLSLIAEGLDWQPGDAVVINRSEFPSNRIPWEAAAARYGLELVDVTLDPGPDPAPEAALLEALERPDVRLLTVSAVQYGTGLRMDLPRLAAACRERGVLLCVDAIQQLGALRFDLAEVDADFVIADGHKWLLGPEGLGVFYCRPEVRERLRLTQYGWHMVEDVGNYETKEWAVAGSARRFEAGSPNLLGIHALEASLTVLQDDVGMDAVEAGVRDNASRIAEAVDAAPELERISQVDAHRGSGIVTFCAPGADSGALYRSLRDEGVICAARGGGVRFSPHFYLEPAQMDHAVERAAALARAVRG